MAAERYLYRFGFQKSDDIESDCEDSQCCWIVADSNEEALTWGRQVSERFVADRWPAAGSWIASSFAHWIEDRDTAAIDWADANAPSCNAGEYPIWP